MRELGSVQNTTIESTSLYIFFFVVVESTQLARQLQQERTIPKSFLRS